MLVIGCDVQKLAAFSHMLDNLIPRVAMLCSIFKLRLYVNVLEVFFACPRAGRYTARFSMYKALDGHSSHAWRPDLSVHMRNNLVPYSVRRRFKVQLHVTEDS